MERPELIIFDLNKTLIKENSWRDLNIDIFGANNEFVFDKNNQLIDIRTVGNDTDYKIWQLKDLCGAQGIAPTDCLCVGDGDNDVPLFELTGCGVTFED
jgi:phosphoserine phosphatase